MMKHDPASKNVSLEVANYTSSDVNSSVDEGLYVCVQLRSLSASGNRGNLSRMCVSDMLQLCP